MGDGVPERLWPAGPVRAVTHADEARRAIGAGTGLVVAQAAESPVTATPPLS
jgi:hypothetical protein